MGWKNNGVTEFWSNGIKELQSKWLEEIQSGSINILGEEFVNNKNIAS
ncbi:MAG TPA: hypothetical protein VIK26_00920 [Clostridium sp.]